MIKMSYNRCKDTHKFENKYLPSVYKTQVDFRSHFSGKKSASYSPRNMVNFWSVGSMVSIASGPLAGWYRVRVLVGRKDFSLLQKNQTSSGAQPAFC